MFPLHDPVCVLLETPFSTWKNEDKKDFLNSERPLPSLEVDKLGKSKDKIFVRKFRSEWYSEYKWLCGSFYLKKLFCMPCLIIGVKSGVWNKDGFNNFGNVTRGCHKHEASSDHIRRAFTFAELKKSVGSKIVDALRENCRLNIKIHNDNVLLNRRFMELPIRAALYLGKQELAFQAPNESDSSENSDNFKELLNAFISISPVDIQEHYKKISYVISANCKTIQNELIECISDYIDQYIDNEIKECLFFSIQVDDSTDIQKFQCSIIIRYVNSVGKLVERFLGFFDVSSCRTAGVLFDLVMKSIENYAWRSKLVGQCFDGTSVMAEQLSSLQSNIKNEVPQALFLHCTAHRFNSLLQHSCNSISECRIFFANVAGFSSFFNHFTKTTYITDTIVKRIIPASLLKDCTSNSKIVSVINNEWDSVKQVFTEIINDNSSDQTSIRQSLGFLNLFNDFEFALLIGIFGEIFAITDVLCDVLQERSLDINYRMTQIESTLKLLCEIRNKSNFKNVFELASTKVPIPEIYSDGGHSLTANEIFEKYKILYYEVLDTISEQINIRFQDLDKTLFVTLMDVTRFAEYSNNFPTETLNDLQNFYPNIFSDLPRLKNELCFIYKDEKYRNLELDLIFQVLHENRDIFKEAHKLFCLILTIPSTSVSNVTNFSCLNRIETYLRNSSTDDRPTGLAKISIEKELLNELINTEPFYEDIINKFAALDDRKIDLMFKK